MPPSEDEIIGFLDGSRMVEYADLFDAVFPFPAPAVDDGDEDTRL